MSILKILYVSSFSHILIFVCILFPISTYPFPIDYSLFLNAVDPLLKW